VSEIAMKNALKTAGISLWDIQILELYDQSTLMEMISLEDLGFCKHGKAWTSIYESCQDYKGYYEIDGKKIFVNMNGGLKADGNPLGATGGAQIFEVFKQLRGEAGERQVKTDKELKYGSILELEGFGTKGYVYIFGRD
jgi:acetyl-CoA C-acetyltransferase